MNIIFHFIASYTFIHSLIRINRFKSGKVVIILAGRFAGRKAVVVKASDEGTHSLNLLFHIYIYLWIYLFP